MASALFTNFLDHCLGQDAATGTRPDLDTGTIKVGIVNSTTDWSPTAATDTTWNDAGAYTLDAGYNSEANQTLSNKVILNGNFDNTADITFTAVAIDGAKTVDVVAHYLSTGVITTDTLLCFHDAFTPVTPNGGDIVIAYHGSGIFSL